MFSNRPVKVQPAAKVKHHKAPVTKKNIVSKVKNLEKKIIKVAKTDRPQTKYTDTAASGIVTEAGMIINTYVNLAQNDTEQGFVGSDIKVTSQFCRFAITANATANANFLRCIFFWDKEPKGSNPTVADVLENGTDFLSPINRQRSKRFKILRDATYAVATGSDQLLIDKIHIKMHQRLTRFDTSVSSVIPETGGLYILAISDQATNGPTLNYYNRVYFHSS